jgi:phosphatidylinositol alpha-mannosyltransferase
MKIGLVSPYDYSYPGGVNVHVSYLAHEFALMGHQCKVIAPCHKKSISYFGEDAISVGRPFPVPRNGSLARITISPWLPVELKKVLKEGNFDVVHIHEPFVPLLSLSALLESNAINVGTFHAYWSKPRAYWLLQSIFGRWLPKLQGKIAVSEAAMQYVSRYLPGDYRIIPNGVDIDFFSPRVLPLEEFCDGKLNILFIGRLEKQKGVDHLLRAYAKVKNQFPQVRLIIAGPGVKLRHKYEEMVKDNNLADVAFVGFVPKEQLSSYYASADICCFPATSGESFGIVILEAMASGKPVVASNIEGYNEVLSHGEEGLLVPPKDEEALAQALLSLLKDESLRQVMGVKGRAKAEEYSWAKVAQKVIDYYVTLLDEAY